VRRRIEQAFSDLAEVRVLVYEPQKKVPLPASIRRESVPKMTPGRAVLVELMYRYIQGLLDPSISLLELHKLMYFAQEAGEPLRLRFVKGPYGPYAENLRHVLHAIEGYYISGHGAGGDEPRKVLELVPGALEDARRVLEAHEETQERLRRVVELIEGFESPHGLELLATVHWIATKERPESEEELSQRFYAWDERKRRFTRNQILLAVRVLQEKGWVES
jgi:O-acetyl-ADP-ribose deacetylase (regulator of RNase III)